MLAPLTLHPSSFVAIVDGIMASKSSLAIPQDPLHAPSPIVFASFLQLLHFTTDDWYQIGRKV